MSLYKNKYRIESTRLRNWDYSLPGYYFVTICTYHHKNYFGTIDTDFNSNTVHLSPLGKIAKDEWLNTEIIRKNVSLDEFVIMPNHLHGIIIIEGEDMTSVPPKTGESQLIETKANQFGPQRKNLGSIVGGFKAAVTKAIHDSGYNEFAWQGRFIDHIARNEKALNRIREYIYYNPLKWKYDKYFN